MLWNDIAVLRLYRKFARGRFPDVSRYVERIINDEESLSAASRWILRFRVS